MPVWGNNKYLRFIQFYLWMRFSQTSQTNFQHPQSPQVNAGHCFNLYSIYKISEPSIIYKNDLTHRQTTGFPSFNALSVQRLCTLSDGTK